MDRKTQREWIIKVLYEMDIKDLSSADIEDILVSHDLEDYDFIQKSLVQIFNDLGFIDNIINKYLRNKSLDKIPAIDRAILRNSVNEFVISKTIPTNVSINEAVEIAKKYSREDSYKLINGILSSLDKEYK